MIDLPMLEGAGGAEHLAALTTATLDRNRFEPVVCATRPITSPHPALVESGTPVLLLDRRSALSLASWRPLIQLLRRERIDVVHAHMFGSNLWGSVIGRLTGVPVVLAHEHTWSFEGNLKRRLLDRYVIGKLATAVLAVSEHDRQRMIEIEKLSPAKVIHVPNGIPPLAEPTGRDVRAELGIPAGAPLVVSISVLRRQKALDVLVRAAQRIHAQAPDVRFLIVGDGPELQGLVSLAGELRLDDVVVFAGERSDIADLLAASDVAASSSSFEGSPLALMEAIGSGKPVVATRVGGVPEIVRDGLEGILVEPGDPAGLADALLRLVRDPELRARMGASGRAHQRSEFDLGVMVGRLERLYESLFARTERAHREGWAPAEAA